MAVDGAVVRTPRDLPERARRGFFNVFFPLLLVAIAAAEWALVARVLGRAGVTVPALVHVLGPGAFWVLNRVIVRGPRRTALLGHAVRAYAAFAFTSVFAGLLLLVFALLGTVVSAGATLLGVGGAPAPWVSPAFVDLSLAGVGGLFLYGYTLGQRALTVTPVAVDVPALPPALDGFRIVHLSDLHVGAYLGPEELADHVERANALAPDLVCITGDLVDRADTCAWAFPILAGLRARHGVLVTLGNHDVRAGAAEVTAALRALTPFTVLRDACAGVPIGGTTLAVVGVDDCGRDWARGVEEHPALPRLVATVRRGTPLLVLSHRPDCFLQAAELGAFLMLSGHTHGGQLALPALPGRRVRNLAEFVTAFDRGLYRHAGAVLYVNRGLGFTAQRVRLFTPREIAVLELRAA